MTHVCFVNMPIEYYSPISGGAISTIIREVATALHALGHTTSVLTWTDGGPVHGVGDVQSLGPRPELEGPPLLADKVTRRLLGREHSGYEQYRRGVQAALRRRVDRPDLVVVFNDYLSPRWLRRSCSPATTVVTWLQNDQPLPHGRWDGRRGPQAVLACSDYIRGRAIGRGVPMELVSTAASGVDSTAFAPREDWLQPVSPPRVLTIGRLDPNKGHDAAIAAVRRLQREGQELVLTLAGARWWYGNEAADPYTDQLLADLKRVGGHHLGLVPRTEVAQVFRDHDVCLVLSRAQEPFGLVVLEAMASGCAVIAADRGGLPQACGDAGLLVDPDDEDAVARALGGLVSRPGRLAAVKQASRARAVAAPWSVAARVLLDAHRLTA